MKLLSIWGTLEGQNAQISNNWPHWGGLIFSYHVRRWLLKRSKFGLKPKNFWPPLQVRVWKNGKRLKIHNSPAESVAIVRSQKDLQASFPGLAKDPLILLTHLVFLYYPAAKEARSGIWVKISWEVISSQCKRCTTINSGNLNPEKAKKERESKSKDNTKIIYQNVCQSTCSVSLPGCDICRKVWGQNWMHLLWQTLRKLWRQKVWRAL